MKGCLLLLIVLGLLGLGGVWILGRAGQRAAQAAATETQDPAARRPAFTTRIDGTITAPAAVTRAIRGRIKDPDSLQIRTIHSIEPTQHQGIPCWQIVLTYAAKNSFGAYDTAGAILHMRGSDLLAIQFIDE